VDADGKAHLPAICSSSAATVSVDIPDGSDASPFNFIHPMRVSVTLHGSKPRATSRLYSYQFPGCADRRSNGVSPSSATERTQKQENVFGLCRPNWLAIGSGAWNVTSLAPCTAGTSRSIAGPISRRSSRIYTDSLETDPRMLKVFGTSAGAETPSLWLADIWQRRRSRPVDYKISRSRPAATAAAACRAVNIRQNRIFVIAGLPGREDPSWVVGHKTQPNIILTANAAVISPRNRNVLPSRLPVDIHRPYPSINGRNPVIALVLFDRTAPGLWDVCSPAATFSFPWSIPPQEHHCVYDVRRLGVGRARLSPNGRPARTSSRPVPFDGYFQPLCVKKGLLQRRPLLGDSGRRFFRCQRLSSGIGSRHPRGPRGP